MRKAIQTWVAIVLAIIIAIAIAVPIYLWVATLTAPKETKVGKGNMVIEDISWKTNSTAYWVRIVVKNTGSISLVISDVYVKQGALTIVHFSYTTEWTANPSEKYQLYHTKLLNSTSYGLYYYDNNTWQQTDTEVSIAVGSSVVIFIVFWFDYQGGGQKGQQWSSGYSYTFKIVATSGAVAEETQVAP